MIIRICEAIGLYQRDVSSRFLMSVAKEPLMKRFEFLVKMARVVLPEYRFKWPQVGWWKVEWFTAYLVRFDEDGGFNTDRKWMVYQLMRLVMAIKGDTVECGVYKGATSWLMCKANKEALHDRTHYLFDSFAGLSRPTNHDGAYWQEGDLNCGVDEVKENLQEFDKTLYLEGWIPSRFEEVRYKTFSFVHIDVDLYEPTKQCLEFFYPRLAAGGIILCDDYGFDTCPGATKALDDFFSDKLEKPLLLSGGGGFMIKGTKTA